MNKLLIAIILIFISLSMFATHNRAGEITYKQISDFTYEITVITYTNTKPTSTGLMPADRDALTVEWGDNTYSIVARNQFVDMPDYYRWNKYVAHHTFPGPGIYEIVVEDPNRNEGVDNIPNSINIVFSIKTIMQINPALGFNNTPILLNPPVDKAALGELFIHNPAAYDPDGDSLSYKLTTCTGIDGEPISGYVLPNYSNRFYVNERTGDLVWDTPVEIGIYNVAILIEEWRHGIQIGRITRDMQIEVYDTDNEPPVIDSLQYYCVEANKELEFEVSAHDKPSDQINLTATGGVFYLNNPAVFHPITALENVTQTFRWHTNCSNVRKQPYLVIFKAQDNDSEISLVDIKNVEIQVNGPAIKNISLDPTNNSIGISWSPSECNQVTAYNIYRSTNKTDFVPDICTVGVPSDLGYDLIATTQSFEDTTYNDNNDGYGLIQGYQYCYIITAIYPDGVESYASEETCTQLIRGIPVITNISVITTDKEFGKIYLAWSKPSELDTTLAPGPYTYKIYRSNDIWGSSFYYVDSTYQNGLNDTIYIDSIFPLNTEEFPHSYKIELHNNEGLIDQPMIASSVFLEMIPTDNEIGINIIKNTPWINNNYTIYREKLEAWDSIGYSTSTTFLDTGLINNHTYCYKIKSTGSYNLSGFINPIINYSHIKCGYPYDNIAPPAPILSVLSNCDMVRNELSWKFNDYVDDVVSYNIYYSPFIDSSLYNIHTIHYRDSMYYNHYPTLKLGACYEVTALDTFNNESPRSNRVCVDSCLYYELPNVFTPNGDEFNPLFVPITSVSIIEKYIDKVDLKVFNRWGNLVFETDDKFLNWDGKNLKNKQLPSGVYYYVCNVYERRITGVEARYLVGFIHIF